MTEQAAFQGFSTDAITFLRDLKANNDRAWFNDHKEVYEREIKQPAEAFAAAMTAALEELTGKPLGYKIFRIHRDVRFSRDKTPYNTHLRIGFIPEHDMAQAPSWFFGLDPEALNLGTGIFAFDKAGLDGFRERLLGPDGAELVDMMKKLERGGVRLGKPDLKRVPAGYPKDHPRADLFRYKGLSAWIDRSDTTSATDPALVDACMADFIRLKPVYDWLST